MKIAYLLLTLLSMPANALECLYYRVPESMKLNETLARVQKCSKNIYHCVRIQSQIEGKDEAMYEGRCALSKYECNNDGCGHSQQEGQFPKQVTTCCSSVENSNTSNTLLNIFTPFVIVFLVYILFQ